MPEIKKIDYQLCRIIGDRNGNLFFMWKNFYNTMIEDAGSEEQKQQSPFVKCITLSKLTEWPIETFSQFKP